jgi:hypothetical protein
MSLSQYSFWYEVLKKITKVDQLLKCFMTTSIFQEIILSPQFLRHLIKYPPSKNHCQHLLSKNDSIKNFMDMLCFNINNNNTNNLIFVDQIFFTVPKLLNIVFSRINRLENDLYICVETSSHIHLYKIDLDKTFHKDIFTDGVLISNNKSNGYQIPFTNDSHGKYYRYNTHIIDLMKYQSEYIEEKKSIKPLPNESFVVIDEKILFGMHYYSSQIIRINIEEVISLLKKDDKVGKIFCISSPKLLSFGSLKNDNYNQAMILFFYHQNTVIILHILNPSINKFDFDIIKVNEFNYCHFDCSTQKFYWIEFDRRLRYHSLINAKGNVTVLDYLSTNYTNSHIQNITHNIIAIKNEEDEIIEWHDLNQDSKYNFPKKASRLVNMKNFIIVFSKIQSKILLLNKNYLPNYTDIDFYFHKLGVKDNGMKFTFDEYHLFINVDQIKIEKEKHQYSFVLLRF